MEHLTITEVPTVPAGEIRPGQQLRDGRIVTEVLSIKNDSHRVLRLNDGDSIQRFKDDPVPVADPKPNYANTYWCHKGKHEALDKELRKLVPSSGEVENSDDHPALERYRVASNCYYDLYNNGLGNRAFEFITAFGFCAIALTEEGRDDCDDFSGHEHRDHPIELTQELIDRTESTMDAIILAAAHEQHIGETVTGTTIDITPLGMATREGCNRVSKVQQDWDNATHAVANAALEFFDTHEGNILEAMDDFEETHSIEGFRDDLNQIRALLGARNRKQEAFLRAVAGK